MGAVCSREDATGVAMDATVGRDVGLGPTVAVGASPLVGAEAENTPTTCSSRVLTRRPLHQLCMHLFTFSSIIIFIRLPARLYAASA